jgi:PAS domain S-box-containing protein
VTLVATIVTFPDDPPVATFAPRVKRSSIELVLRKGSIAEQGALGEQFELLVSNVVDYAIFLLDPTGVIASWNEGAERIKGYRAEEVIGRHFSIFYPLEDTRNRKPEWELEVARREGRYAEEGWRLRKDGTRFWASVVITALRDETGRLRGFGKVTRDLTERHELEEQRNAERDAEAQRLREHATSMAELEHAKTEFLNLASHELRGPLTVIRGYNSMLEDGSIPAEQIPTIARLLEAKLAQMDLLIEQMLETARLEHDVLELSRDRFDVRWVAQEQLDIFRPLAHGHHFVVEPAREPLLVEGDRSRIATIVANFMDNAIKYSPDGGEICIISGRRGVDVFVSVRDHGIGISAEHMPRMFTRFGRLPTEENMSIAGTGLGLFLCKEIAVRHGGDITVRSQPGEGSEFTLTLPSAR